MGHASSLGYDLGIHQLADDGVPDEAVVASHVRLLVQDPLRLRGDVLEDLLVDPAGVACVVLKAAFVIEVHAAAAVAISVDLAGHALLPPLYGAAEDVGEAFGLEQLRDRSDLVYVAHPELLRTGLRARIDGAIRIDAYPLR